MKSQYPALVSSLNNLALLRRMERRYSEAEPFYTEALEIAELVWGGKSSDHANYSCQLRDD